VLRLANPEDEIIFCSRWFVSSAGVLDIEVTAVSGDPDQTAKDYAVQR